MDDELKEAIALSMAADGDDADIGRFVNSAPAPTVPESAPALRLTEILEEVRSCMFSVEPSESVTVELEKVCFLVGLRAAANASWWPALM